MDTEEDPANTGDLNTSSDDSHNTNESIDQKADNPLTDDSVENLEMAKAHDNGNIIFDFEGNFVFPSYERNTLDWDSLNNTIGFTTEQNTDGIYMIFQHWLH